MIQGVRNDIYHLLGHEGLMRQGRNLSLYFSRLCRKIDEPSRNEHSAKDDAIDQLEFGLSQEAHGLYKRAFDKWKAAWKNTPDSLCVEMICRTPLIVGMGDQNILEFGISLQRPWGTPFIPGSAIKGVAAAHAQKAGGAEWMRNLKNAEPDGAFAEAVFGGVNAEGRRTAGGVGFSDAWWVPDSRQPFIKDIINVHYRKYYQGMPGAWPDGTDAPLPVYFIAIRPETRFLMALSGPPEACKAARQIIISAGESMGFGGKTRVGYGRMRHVEDVQDLMARLDEVKSAELAKLFSKKGGDADYQDFFAKAARRHTCSPELDGLFRKYRPAALFLERLRREKPVDLKAAGKIRKDFSTTMPASAIDPTDKDVQAIFNHCRPLAKQGIPGTWLEAFAYGFDDMIRGKDYKEIEKILIDHIDDLQSGKSDWPIMERIRQDLNKLDALTDAQIGEIKEYLEMAEG